MKVLYISAVILFYSTSSYGQWTNFGYTSKVLAFHVHKSSLYASIQPGEVEQFTPNLKGWHRSDTGLQGAKITTFVSIGPYLFASSDAGVVYGSSDSGSSWYSLKAAGPIATNGKYLFATDNITGTDPHIRRSGDFGKSWEEVLDVATNYMRGNGSSVYLISGNKMWRSLDSGSSVSWDSIGTPIRNIQTIEFMGSMVFGANGTSGEGLIRSDDTGKYWTALPWAHRSILAMTSIDSFLFAGTDSGVYVSSDLGTTWHAVNDGLPTVAQVNNLCVFDTLIFIAQTTGGNDFIYYRPLHEMIPPKSAVEPPLAVRDTIAIYPNPTTSSVHIDFGSASVHRIELLNLLGESKQIITPREQSVSLDLAQLPSGTYFLRFETAKGTVMRKIVKE